MQCSLRVPLSFSHRLWEMPPTILQFQDVKNYISMLKNYDTHVLEVIIGGIINVYLSIIAHIFNSVKKLELITYLKHKKHWKENIF